MNLGAIAAGAAEEIRQQRSISSSPNLKMLAIALAGEPMYDPVIQYTEGRLDRRLQALGYCEDIALVEGTLPLPA